jgi:hypothetical protein
VVAAVAVEEEEVKEEEKRRGSRGSAERPDSHVPSTAAAPSSNPSFL